MESEILSGFKFELTNRLITMITGALLLVFLARTLGPDGYGNLFLAFSIISVFKILASYGISNSAARYLTESAALESNPGKVIAWSFVIITIISVLALILLLAFSQPVANYMRNQSLVMLLVLGSIYLVTEIYFKYSRVLLQGLEAIKLSAVVSSTKGLCTVVFVVIFVGLGFATLGALVGYIFGSLISGVLGLYFLYNNYGDDEKFSINNRYEIPEKILRYSVPLTVTSSSDVLDKKLDTILVGFFMNPVAVAHYELSKQIVGFIRVPVSSLGFTISPTFGKDKVKEDIESARRTYNESIKYTLWVYIPASVGVVLTSENIITIIFGDDYFGAVLVMQIFSLYILFNSLTNITSKGLDYMGRAKIRAYVKSATALLNVILNVLLIPRVGVEGAAIATIITYGIYTTICYMIMNNEIGLNHLHILNPSIKSAIVTSPMFIYIYFGRTYAHSLTSVALLIGSSILIWLITSLYVGFLSISKLKRLYK